MNSIHVVNLKEKLGLFDAFWEPKIVGELNGQYVKLAKLKGEFIWHIHEKEDELFLVVKGVLKIELEESVLELNPGEFVVIPRGVRHRPVAEKEVQVMLFEPASTLNTGDSPGELTIDALEEI